MWRKSRILSVEGPKTFTRPIYAGNAIATVEASDAKLVVTVRATAFAKAGATGGSGGCRSRERRGRRGLSSFVGAEIAKSERPELTSAKIIVSGGRALKDAETFAATITPLADKLGAAIGASRAAVDAGYVPNDYQVGQTGKIVAPVAVGISGAIQHLAGMKDQDHHRHQQGRGRADLPGRRRGPGRRPVQAVPELVGKL
jgi:electron transfer flavoprotein alpha subunit